MELQATRMASCCPPSPPRLADYFVVCGLNESCNLELDTLIDSKETAASTTLPSRKCYKAAVLACFPSDASPVTTPMRQQQHNHQSLSQAAGVPAAPRDLDLDAVRMLCLPCGLTIRDQRNVAQPKFHPFLITREDGSRQYGFSLVFYEEIVDSERFRQQLQVSPDDFGRNIKLFATKSICFLSNYPFAAAFRALLLGIYHRAILQSSQASAAVNIDTYSSKIVWLPLESYVFNVLYEISLPPPGQSIQCMCFPHNEIVLCMPSAAANELPLLDYSVRELFALFEVTKLVDLVCAAALEHQILLFSQDYSRLMLVAETIAALLLPFTWQSVFVPILPASLQCFVDAPVPFIMGLHVNAASSIGEEAEEGGDTAASFARADMCFANIDTGSVHLPEEMLKLPLRKELCYILQKLYKTMFFEHATKSPAHSRSSTPAAAAATSGTDAEQVLQMNSDLAKMICKLDAADEDSNNDMENLVADDDNYDQVDNILSESLTTAAANVATQKLLTQWNNNASPHNRRSHHVKRFDQTNPAVQHKQQKSKVGLHHGRRLKSLASLDACKPPSVLSSHSVDAVQQQNQQQQEIADVQFNELVRRTFLHAFVYMLYSYDMYVIYPATSSTAVSDSDDAAGMLLLQSPGSRETFENFDQVAFLSDQPEAYMRFLSAFLETQLFASFIDKKISSNSKRDVVPDCDAESRNVYIFDDVLRQAKSLCGEDMEFRKLSFTNFVDSMPVDTTQLVARLTQPTLTAPAPHRLPLPPVTTTGSNNNRGASSSATLSGRQSSSSSSISKFPTLDANMLSLEHAAFVLQHQQQPPTPSHQHQQHASVRHSSFSSSSPHKKMLTRVQSGTTGGAAAAGGGGGARNRLLSSSNVATRNYAASSSSSSSSKTVLSPGTPSVPSKVFMPFVAMNKSQQQPCQSPLPLTTNADLVLTNVNFIETILKECKQKVKKMLMSKMGHEVVEQLGVSHAEAVSDVEENTQISSLCDMIERIWAHGKATTTATATTASGITMNNNCSKSALWQHLTLFRHQYSHVEAISTANMPPTTTSTLDRRAIAGKQQQQQQQRRMPLLMSNNATLNRRFQQQTSDNIVEKNAAAAVGVANNDADASLRIPPDADLCHVRALLRDIKHILHSVVGVKSSVGHARAFIRLSLEKKILSQHLKTLLTDKQILSETYKPYAFLRSEDEREQFLFHILSLNAVDYFCFTNTYLDTPMPMIIGVNAITSSPDAALWAALCGTHCHTDPFCIPRGAFNFTVKPKNIGLIELVKIGLTTLSDSVSTTSAADNKSGGCRLLLNEVTIQNQITGHLYRFACHRWLGRGVDDDATERWLIGRRVSLAATPTTASAHSGFGAVVNGAAGKECLLRISDDADQDLLVAEQQQQQQSAAATAAAAVASPLRYATNSAVKILPAATAAAAKAVGGGRNTTDAVSSRGRSVEPTNRKISSSSSQLRNGNGTADEAKLANKPSAAAAVRSPSVPRQLACKTKLTPNQIERLLGESANVLVKHFHHAQLQPSNVNGTLRTRGNNTMMLIRHNNKSGDTTTTTGKSSRHRGVAVDCGGGGEHATYVNPFVLLCRPNGIVNRLELALYTGFRTSRFSLWQGGTKQLFLWDFIESTVQHFRADILVMQPNGVRREKLSQTTRDAVEEFCLLVERLNEKASVLGKDGKFRLFVCISLRDKCLARNIELLSRAPFLNDLFVDERCLLRNKELKNWLVKLLDSLAQYNIFFDAAFTKGL